MEVINKILAALKPLTDSALRLWKAEPVLVVAGAFIAARAGYAAVNTGLDISQVVDAVIAAAAAFLARASVFSPATVEALKDVAEG